MIYTALNVIAWLLRGVAILIFFLAVKAWYNGYKENDESYYVMSVGLLAIFFIIVLFIRELDTDHYFQIITFGINRYF